MQAIDAQGKSAFTLALERGKLEAAIKPSIGKSHFSITNDAFFENDHSKIGTTKRPEKTDQYQGPISTVSAPIL